MMHVLVGTIAWPSSSCSATESPPWSETPKGPHPVFQRSLAAPRSCPADPTTGAYGG
jgi:hypothetical protein